MKQKDRALILTALSKAINWNESLIDAHSEDRFSEGKIWENVPIKRHESICKRLENENVEMNAMHRKLRLQGCVK